MRALEYEILKKQLLINPCHWGKVGFLLDICNISQKIYQPKSIHLITICSGLNDGPKDTKFSFWNL